jgi:hypothetical protein
MTMTPQINITIHNEIFQVGPIRTVHQYLVFVTISYGKITRSMMGNHNYFLASIGYGVFDKL